MHQRIRACLGHWRTRLTFRKSSTVQSKRGLASFGKGRDRSIEHVLLRQIVNEVPRHTLHPFWLHIYILISGKALSALKCFNDRIGGLPDFGERLAAKPCGVLLRRLATSTRYHDKCPEHFLWCRIEGKSI
jgi:hypothetical protein